MSYLISRIGAQRRKRKNQRSFAARGAMRSSPEVLEMMYEVGQSTALVHLVAA